MNATPVCPFALGKKVGAQWQTNYGPRTFVAASACRLCTLVDYAMACAVLNFLMEIKPAQKYLSQSMQGAVYAPPPAPTSPLRPTP